MTADDAEVRGVNYFCRSCCLASECYPTASLNSYREMRKFVRCERAASTGPHEGAERPTWGGEAVRSQRAGGVSTFHAEPSTGR